MRTIINKTDDFAQAGVRFRSFDSARQVMLQTAVHLIDMRIACLVVHRGHKPADFRSYPSAHMTYVARLLSAVQFEVLPVQVTSAQVA